MQTVKNIAKEISNQTDETKINIIVKYNLLHRTNQDIQDLFILAIKELNKVEKQNQKLKDIIEGSDNFQHDELILNCIKPPVLTRPKRGRPPKISKKDKQTIALILTQDQSIKH